MKAIIVVFLLITLLAAAGCNRSEAPAEVTTQAQPAVAAESLPSDQQQFAKAGRIEKSRFLAVDSNLAGKISEIYVKQGQAVTVGQPLAKIEPDLSGLGSAEADQKAYDDALKEYTTFQKLYDIGGIPRRQLEGAAAKLAEAQTKMKRGQGLPGTGEPVVIEAPLAGLVMELSLIAGTTVQAGQQILTLGNGQSFQVVIMLEQKDLTLFPLGGPVVIETDGQRAQGQVSAIYPEVQGQLVTAFRCLIQPSNLPERMKQAGKEVKVIVR